MSLMRDTITLLELKWRSWRTRRHNRRLAAWMILGMDGQKPGSYTVQLEREKAYSEWLERHADALTLHPLEVVEEALKQAVDAGLVPAGSIDWASFRSWDWLGKPPTPEEFEAARPTEEELEATRIALEASRQRHGFIP